MQRLRGLAAAAGEISRSESVPSFSPDDTVNMAIGSAYASRISSHEGIRHGGSFLTTTTRVGARDDIQPFFGSCFFFSDVRHMYLGALAARGFHILGACSELP